MGRGIGCHGGRQGKQPHRERKILQETERRGQRREKRIRQGGGSFGQGEERNIKRKGLKDGQKGQQAAGGKGIGRIRQDREARFSAFGNFGVFKAGKPGEQRGHGRVLRAGQQIGERPLHHLRIGPERKRKPFAAQRVKEQRGICIRRSGPEIAKDGNGGLKRDFSRKQRRGSGTLQQTGSSGKRGSKAFDFRKIRSAGNGRPRAKRKDGQGRHRPRRAAGKSR